MSLWIIVAIVVILLLIILPAAIKIVPEWERGVILRLGRFVGLRGPGIIFLIPYIETIQRMDLRIITMDVPAQEVITRDNVTVKVDAVVYFRVMNPEYAVLKVEKHIRATSLIAQTTLRSVLGQSELDELLSQRDRINRTLQQIIDEATDPWGVKVSNVEIKNVELPQTMQRAMAAQAEAERDKRAKIVHAEGEYIAAEKLSQAAHIISSEPSALQLRYLGTLTEIATEKTNTVIFPLPLDIIAPFLGGAGSQGRSPEPSPKPKKIGGPRS
jgi:regulator of protease activity HflC (stomatin/prohibitin superfamily)